MTAAAAPHLSTATTPAPDSDAQRLRLGGAILLIGTLLMVIGAAVWASTGADIGKALDDSAVGEYLVDAAEHRAALGVNLSLWMFGAPLLGLGGVLLSGVGRPPGHAARDAARFVYGVGAATALAAFLMWHGVVRVADRIEIGDAEALAWTAWNLDVAATTLLIGLGPVALVWTAGRTWMPMWLRIWAVIAAVTAPLAWIATPTGASATLGFAIVPVGIGWCIAASIVALRSRHRAAGRQLGS